MATMNDPHSQLGVTRGITWSANQVQTPLAANPKAAAISSAGATSHQVIAKSIVIVAKQAEGRTAEGSDERSSAADQRRPVPTPAVPPPPTHMQPMLGATPPLSAQLWCCTE